jgi:lipoate-protein ligase A
MSEIWDFVQSSADSAAFNMAVDEALLRTAAKRERPLLRVYSWKQPSVSFGYFQRFPGHLAGKYEIVRRPTGGGVVYHGDGIDTTYTVVVPPAHSLFTLSTADAYCAIHKAVAAAIGDQSQITNHRSPVPRTGYECFQNPVAGDVVVDGRKLAGAAQRRTKSGMLHQGSIAVKLSADQLKRGFEKALGVEFMQYKLTETDGTLAEKLACEKYANDAWNRYLH